jgi:hypothetical protein
MEESLAHVTGNLEMTSDFADFVSNVERDIFLYPKYLTSDFLIEGKHFLKQMEFNSRYDHEVTQSPRQSCRGRHPRFNEPVPRQKHVFQSSEHRRA